MGTKDRQVDLYLENAKPFAKKILRHLRELVHQACPDVEESMKWNFPHFSYKGILCSMASFTEHCAFTFWKGSLMKDPHQVMDNSRENSMGQFGRLTSLNDLPPDAVIVEYLKEAMELNQKGIKLPRTRTPAKEIAMPEDLEKALKESPAALKAFQAFPPGKQREYITWLEEAKQAVTRNKRLATAVEWISEGKRLHWKNQT